MSNQASRPSKFSSRGVFAASSALLVLLVLASFAASSAAFATTNVSEGFSLGIDWLRHEQAADGHFGTVVPFRDTPEAIGALSAGGRTFDAEQAVDWLSANPTETAANNDYLSRKIGALVAATLGDAYIFIRDHLPDMGLG